MSTASRPVKERKTIALKFQDGQPLTRTDLQYDLLHHLFSNDQAVFTDPNPTINGQPARSKVTFRDLYLNALIRSPKCSRGPREKALENPEFGTEFAKIAFLTNVGRINTTMAFFPEMRTALRTYHPVPSLQKTDGNLQDAPRIKNILKDCQLPNEPKGLPPPSPSEILTRVVHKQVPSTSIVNMLFSVTHPSYSAIVAHSHLESTVLLDWTDLFVPVPFSSASRARALLWLCFHYLESITFTGNPFADDYSMLHHGRTPQLVRLTQEEMALENVDPQEEMAFGAQMQQRRKEFLAKIKDEADGKAKEKEREKERGIGSIGIVDRSPERRDHSQLPVRILPTRDRPFPPTLHSRISMMDSDVALQDSNNAYMVSRPSNPPNYPRLVASPSAFTLRPHQSEPKRTNASQPYGPRPIVYHLPPPGWPKRTLLSNAFRLATTTDPLADSGEEDEDARCDYILRLHVVNRLRGRQPTPEPDDPDYVPPASTPIDIIREHQSKDARIMPGRSN